MVSKLWWIHSKEYYVAIKNVTDEYIITWRDVPYNEQSDYQLHDPILAYVYTHIHTHRQKNDQKAIQKR